VCNDETAPKNPSPSLTIVRLWHINISSEVGALKLRVFQDPFAGRYTSSAAREMRARDRRPCFCRSDERWIIIIMTRDRDDGRRDEGESEAVGIVECC
jgi:hypothetical protein